MKKSMIAIAAALLGAPAFAQEAYAPPAADNALEFTLGGGYAQGFGDIGGGQRSLTDLTGPGGEIRLGIGYRINPYFLIGVTGSGGILSNADFSRGSNVYTATTSLEANYHFLPWDKLDPWVGLAAGWRALWIDRPIGTESRHGVDVARVTVGVDYRVSPGIAISPYVGAAATLFLTQELAGTRGFVNVHSPDVNVWLSAGIQMRFDFFGSGGPAVRVATANDATHAPAIAQPAIAQPAIAQPAIAHVSDQR
jgi:opacity protein-like surface antigen